MTSKSKAGPERQSSLQSRFIVLAAILALVVLVPLIIWTNLNWILTWVLAWTPVSFLFYGYDKLQALRHRLRVPEISLFAMGVAGGFLGAIGGMLVFRHKTAKLTFWIINLASAAAYAILLIVTML